MSRLQRAWTFRLTGSAVASTPGYGSLAAGPIVAGGVVYLQDLDANVYALRLATGKLLWEYQVGVPEKSGPGPDGVAVSGGVVYGDTSATVFALSARTGKVIWVDKHLLNSGQGAFEIQPQVANSRVYVASAYGTGPGGGVLFALNASNGQLAWRFSTLLGADTGVQREQDRLRRRVGDAAGRRRRLGHLRRRQPLPVRRVGDRPPGRAAVHRQRRQPGRRDREAALVLPGRVR